MAATGTDLSLAASLLEQGELVAIPTETVYGLAANALDAAAVARIFVAKNRPTFDPLIVHIADPAAMSIYARDIPKAAELLAAAFWPGPLTLLLPRKEIIPDLVTSGLDRVGLRCPDHPLIRQLLARLTFPLAAPSANPFGYISPTTAKHVNDQLGDRVGYILDGGPCRIGLESTIVGFEGDETVVYRLGGIPVSAVESAVGPVRLAVNRSADPQAPGQLSSHYAPRTKLVMGLPTGIQAAQPETFAVLSFSKDYGYPNQIILSKSGDTAEAAQRLFAALRELDGSGVSLIYAEPAPEEGLGPAINDRLMRAAC
ncbi:MAG: L-threonylcarbamoyladenylate synthase [Bacteroidota bacterium]